MSRKPLVMGNWKMHGTRAVVETLINHIKLDPGFAAEIEVVVLPSFVHLQHVHEALQRVHHSAIGLGAQNLYFEAEGAFTGEISGAMLADMGCQYVLVGHSERRRIFGESHALVAKKYHAVLQAGLIPVLCIGETKAEREADITETVLEQQLSSVLALVGQNGFDKAVIAYEPVWAIGTGLTASPEQAQAVHVFIRSWLRTHQIEASDRMRIIYGGSVKPDNAIQLFNMPDIDGGLIGGAALDGESFTMICESMLRKGKYNLH